MKAQQIYKMGFIEQQMQKLLQGQQNVKRGTKGGALGSRIVKSIKALPCDKSRLVLCFFRETF